VISGPVNWRIVLARRIRSTAKTPFPREQGAIEIRGSEETMALDMDDGGFN
jgi:hypothetical protein